MSSSITGNNLRVLNNNNFLWKEFIWGLRNRAATWRALTGYTEPGSFAPITKKLVFPGIESIEGYEMGLQFNMDMPEFDTLASGPADNDTVDLEFTDDAEEFTWPLTRYLRHHAVPSREKKLTKGKTVKVGDRMELALKSLARGWVKQVNRELFGNTDQTETSVATLPYIIDDGNVYGYDRADDRYADLRSYVASAPTLTWDDIALARNQVRDDWGGMSEVVIAKTTTYTWIEYLARQINAVQVKQDEKWAGFGGEMFHYGSSSFHSDGDCPSGTIFGLSIETDGLKHWRLARNEEDFVGDRFVKDITRRGFPLVLPFEAYLGVYCATPGAQWKLESVSAPTNFNT